MPFSLEAFDEALEHESFYASLAAVRFLDRGDSAELDFDLRYGWVETGADEPVVAGRVGLRFRGVADWSLTAGWIPSVRVVEGHPALVPLLDSVSRLSYQGEPADPEATLAALYHAHAEGFGRSVATFLQPGASFPQGWTTGTVAVGPTSLMQAYAGVLERHGLQASLLPVPEAAGASEVDLVAYAVGDGYVIAKAVETYGELPSWRDE